jgi:Sec-independent protein secretion pathway component TatC
MHRHANKVFQSPIDYLQQFVEQQTVTCFYFLFPFLSYQIWCFSIPSCYEKKKKKYNNFFYLSGFRFFFSLFFIFVGVVPNIWHCIHDINDSKVSSREGFPMESKQDVLYFIYDIFQVNSF